MMQIDAVLALFPDLTPDELVTWVEQDWVCPECPAAGEWLFLEIDVARVGLVYDLRRRLNMSVDAMPLLLSLIDQVYDLRAQLATVKQALERQPEAIRAALRDAPDPAGRDGDR